MTARGTATLRILSGDIDALRDAVADYLGYEDDTAPNNEIDLDDVNWLDADALIAADPQAVWFAVCSSECEDANLLHMYADHDYLVGDHINGRLVVDADDIDGPWTRTAVAKWNRVRGLTPTPVRETAA